MEKKTEKTKRKHGKVFVFTMLLINFLPILPGLGTLISGNTKKGIIQMVFLWLGGIGLAFLGFVQVIDSPIIRLVLAMVGSLALLIGWGWAIISGVFIIREASL